MDDDDGESAFAPVDTPLQMSSPMRIPTLILRSILPDDHDDAGLRSSWRKHTESYQQEEQALEAQDLVSRDSLVARNTPLRWDSVWDSRDMSERSEMVQREMLAGMRDQHSLVVGTFEAEGIQRSVCKTAVVAKKKAELTASRTNHTYSQAVDER